MKSVKPFAALTFTKFPNDVLDYVMPFVSPNAWKVLCLIMRKTTGWNKAEDDISYSQIQSGTGIVSRSTISAAVRELVEAEMVTRHKASRRAPVTYRLNKDYELSITETIRVVQKSNHSLVQKSDTQKNRKKASAPVASYPAADDSGIYEEPSRNHYRFGQELRDKFYGEAHDH